MYHKEVASLDDFMRAVWLGDDANDGMVKSALSRANEILRMLGEKRVLSRAGGTVRWV